MLFAPTVSSQHLIAPNHLLSHSPDFFTTTLEAGALVSFQVYVQY